MTKFPIQRLNKGESGQANLPWILLIIGIITVLSIIIWQNFSSFLPTGDSGVTNSEVGEATRVTEDTSDIQDLIPTDTLEIPTSTSTPMPTETEIPPTDTPVPTATREPNVIINDPASEDGTQVLNVLMAGIISERDSGKFPALLACEPYYEISRIALEDDSFSGSNLEAKYKGEDGWYVVHVNFCASPDDDTYSGAVVHTADSLRSSLDTNLFSSVSSNLWRVSGLDVGSDPFFYTIVRDEIPMGMSIEELSSLWSCRFGTEIIPPVAVIKIHRDLFPSLGKGSAATVFWFGECLP